MNAWSRVSVSFGLKSGWKITYCKYGLEILEVGPRLQILLGIVCYVYEDSLS